MAGYYMRFYQNFDTLVSKLNDLIKVHFQCFVNGYFPVSKSCLSMHPFWLLPTLRIFYCYCDARAGTILYAKNILQNPAPDYIPQHSCISSLFVCFSVLTEDLVIDHILLPSFPVAWPSVCLWFQILFPDPSALNS